jgi:integrase
VTLTLAPSCPPGCPLTKAFSRRKSEGYKLGVIKPALGDRRIGSIRQSDIQGLVKALEGKNLAAGTVRNIYDTAARIFASAVDDRVIPSSPCRRVKLPKDDKGEVVPLTLAQVRSLEAGMGDLGAAVIALAGSGLRIGELLGLHVSDVDFLRRTIRVRRQRAQSNELTPPKSKSSDRTVTVGQTVIDALAAHLKAGERTTGPLIVNALGRPLTYWQWKLGFSGRPRRTRPRSRPPLTRCGTSTPAR